VLLNVSVLNAKALFLDHCVRENFLLNASCSPFFNKNPYSMCSLFMLIDISHRVRLWRLMVVPFATSPQTELCHESLTKMRMRTVWEGRKGKRKEAFDCAVSNREKCTFLGREHFLSDPWEDKPFGEPVNIIIPWASFTFRVFNSFRLLSDTIAKENLL